MRRLALFIIVSVLGAAVSAQTPTERGEYLTNLLNCAYCHTPGGLIGEPDYGKHLSGSSLGLAYTAYQKPDRPAVVFPGNLTPDKDTGLGGWTDDEIAMVIRAGVDSRGRQHVPVMPWPGYATLKPEDVSAIVAYLRTLQPIRAEIPDNVVEGEVSEHGWVRFGVYEFTAEGAVSEHTLLDLR